VTTPSESTCSGLKRTPALGSAVVRAAGVLASDCSVGGAERTLAGRFSDGGWASAMPATADMAAPANKTFLSTSDSPQKCARKLGRRGRL